MLGALTDVPPALSSANDELPIAYGAYGNYLSGRAAETQSEAADAIEYFEAVLDREGASYELIDRIFRLSVGSGDVDFAAVAAKIATLDLDHAPMLEIISREPDRDIAHSIEALASLHWS